MAYFSEASALLDKSVKHIQFQRAKQGGGVRATGGLFRSYQWLTDANYDVCVFVIAVRWTATFT